MICSSTCQQQNNMCMGTASPSTIVSDSFRSVPLLQRCRRHWHHHDNCMYRLGCFCNTESATLTMRYTALSCVVVHFTCATAHSKVVDMRHPCLDLDPVLFGFQRLLQILYDAPDSSLSFPLPSDHFRHNLDSHVCTVVQEAIFFHCSMPARLHHEVRLDAFVVELNTLANNVLVSSAVPTIEPCSVAVTLSIVSLRMGNHSSAPTRWPRAVQKP